jgi:hypothetical protein
MSQIIIVPSAVREKLLPNEKVIFTGSYNRKDGNVQLINSNNAAIFTALSNISTNPEGYNVFNVKIFVVTDQINSIFYADETYNISSWNRIPTSLSSTTVGQIQWAGLYNNEKSTIVTSPGVERFIITGKDGIYENVTCVLINYLADSSRIIYFVGRDHPPSPVTPPIIKDEIIQNTVMNL